MLAVRLDEDILITENDIYDEIINAQAIEKISEYELGSINQLEDEDGVLRGALSIRLNRRGRMLQHTIIDLLLNLSEV